MGLHAYKRTKSNSVTLYVLHIYYVQTIANAANKRLVFHRSSGNYYKSRSMFVATISFQPHIP